MTRVERPAGGRQRRRRVMENIRRFGLRQRQGDYRTREERNLILGPGLGRGCGCRFRVFGSRSTARAAGSSAIAGSHFGAGGR